MSKGGITRFPLAASVSKEALQVVEDYKVEVKSRVVDKALLFYGKYEHAIRKLEGTARANDLEPTALLENLLSGEFFLEARETRPA